MMNHYWKHWKHLYFLQKIYKIIQIQSCQYKNLHIYIYIFIAIQSSEITKFYKTFLLSEITYTCKRTIFPQSLLIYQIF